MKWLWTEAWTAVDAPFEKDVLDLSLRKRMVEPRGVEPLTS